MKLGFSGRTSLDLFWSERQTEWWVCWKMVQAQLLTRGGELIRLRFGANQFSQSVGIFFCGMGEFFS